MKLTTHNIEGLPELLELPGDFKDFLLQPETQKQLNTYDIKGIYDKLNLSKVKYIGLFTQLLYSIDINPLDYLEYIPYFFLDSASLVTIKIPNNIKSINNYAFYNCSKLGNIKYTGTKDQWLKINHEYRWNGVSPIKTIHCIDGDIEL